MDGDPNLEMSLAESESVLTDIERTDPTHENRAVETAIDEPMDSNSLENFDPTALLQQVNTNEII